MIRRFDVRSLRIVLANCSSGRPTSVYCCARWFFLFKISARGFCPFLLARGGFSAGRTEKGEIGRRPNVSIPRYEQRFAKIFTYGRVFLAARLSAREERGRRAAHVGHEEINACLHGPTDTVVRRAISYNRVRLCAMINLTKIALYTSLFV